MRTLSENVYRHLIRFAVPDVTEDEVTRILELYPNNNPLDNTIFIGNVIHSNDIPKEGPIDFFISIAKMVMQSNDPIRKAFRLAIEYIDNDGIIIDNESIEESADAYELLYKMRVQFSREDRMDQEN